jgi:glycosyltransferase involved in cell wall biosynthesis
MKKSFSATFILPGPGQNPIGGYKVVYRYANELARRGHKITVVHPNLLMKDTSLWTRIVKFPRYIQRKVRKSFVPNWIHLNRSVQVKWVPSLKEKYIPNSDVVIATAWPTSEWVQEYSDSKGKHVYFIQDYEYYMSADATIKERITQTYNFGMKMIGISPAVVDLVKSLSNQDVEYVPNGIDMDTFYLTANVDNSSRTLIGFPMRGEKFKGAEDALETVKKLNHLYDHSLRFWSFGGRKPNNLPHNVEYYERPTNAQLRQLYNRTQIFFVPSHYEGWGLPGSEAMACGAALVTTDNGGARAYADHDITALIVPPKAPEEMANAIASLLNDIPRRILLAKNGYTHIQEFTWNRAVDRFERVIFETLEA